MTIFHIYCKCNKIYQHVYVCSYRYFTKHYLSHCILLCAFITVTVNSNTCVGTSLVRCMPHYLIIVLTVTYMYTKYINKVLITTLYKYRFLKWYAIVNLVKHQPHIIIAHYICNMQHCTSFNMVYQSWMKWEGSPVVSYNTWLPDVCALKLQDMQGKI